MPRPIAPFVRCQIYKPGQLVRHDGRVWLMAYPGAITCVDCPGEEEYSRVWVAMDGAKWRKTSVPCVERRGWRRRTMLALIRQADLNEALFMRLPDRWPERQHAMREATRRGLNMERENNLRRSLGLTAQELSDIMSVRRCRRRARLAEMMNAEAKEGQSDG